MKTTILTPLYEYIFKKMDMPGSTWGEYDTEFFQKKTITEQDVCIREKIIWDKTKEFISVKNIDDECLKKLNQLQLSASQDCNLCAICKKCEKNYWIALKNYLENRANDYIYKNPYNYDNDIRSILEPQQKPEELYVELRCKMKFPVDNCLIMLKGTSSSTPLMLNHATNTDFYRGGGFYLRWQEHGIAIDPGYKYLDSLHECGLNIMNINSVIVTHEHIDHNSDIRKIDDLHSKIASGCSSDCTLHWYMDEVSCELAEILSKSGSGFIKDKNIIETVSFEDDKYSVEYKFSNEIVAKFIRTSHIKDEKNHYKHHTFGVKFMFGNSISIGYTSDTSAQDESVFTNLIKQLSDCDIIIANISSIYKSDFLYGKYKDKHLGYHGCFKLLEGIMESKESKLQYFILSEFTNLVSDIRFAVSKSLQKDADIMAKKNYKKSPKVVPMEIGMTIDLKKMGIQCSSCGSFFDKFYIVRPASEREKIKCICDNCYY